ncbi:MAG: hypothetical protein ACYSWZ_19630 [Planctomycetota bacterium]
MLSDRGEGNVQTIVEKWIRLGFFTCVWPGKGNRNRMPFFQLSADIGFLSRTVTATLQDQSHTIKLIYDGSFPAP